MHEKESMSLKMQEATHQGEWAASGMTTGSKETGSLFPQAHRAEFCQRDWACVHFSKCLVTHTHVHKHTYTHTRTHTYNLYTHICTHTYTHSKIFTHIIHTCTHTHTHTHTQILPLSSQNLRENYILIKSLNQRVWFSSHSLSPEQDEF